MGGLRAAHQLQEGPDMAEKIYHTVKNIAPGPRGLHSTGGHVLLEKGESRQLEIEDGELKSAKASGHFEISAGKGESSGDGLDDQTVAQLRELAAKESIDLGEATKQGEIVAAIRASGKVAKKPEE